MVSEYFVKLEQFEGPLDLLLHLIRQHEIDVFDIDIVLLTTQYLNYLRMVKFEDLGIAGAFLDMASALIQIKSRMLLPGSEGESPEDEGDADEDPREALQQRLVEYDMFTKAAEFLSESPQFGVQIHPSNEWERLEPQYSHIEAPLTGDKTTLVVMLEQLFRSVSERKPVRVEAKRHMVSQEEITARLQQYMEQVRFVLFQGLYQKFKSRYELVVYVLALLEEVKGKRLKVYQQEVKGPMWVYRSDIPKQELPAEIAENLHD